MITVISPAKTLDFCQQELIQDHSTPDFLNDSKTLVSQLKKLSPGQIGELMGVSPKLAELNAERFRTWKQPFSPTNAKQSLLAFKGDVYTDIETDRFSAADFEFAQSHLRILSGLYGILRPLDLMQPYRLEMGTRLKTKRGDNLYAFWGLKITKALNTALESSGSDTLVNLASNEYFGSIVPDKLDSQIITPIFKDTKNGKLKFISFFAKRARGMMANYIIRKRITDPLQLKKFKVAGYKFDKSLSSETEYTFVRAEQPAANS
ncbi:MAG: peroxide stress protein YaaA [Verrucomicrobiales bacterium]